MECIAFLATEIALAVRIFAETDSELVAAMPIGGTVKLPDDVVMDLPWRR